MSYEVKIVRGKPFVVIDYPGRAEFQKLIEEADRRGISVAELKKGRPLTQEELERPTGRITRIVDGGDY